MNNYYAKISDKKLLLIHKELSDNFNLSFKYWCENIRTISTLFKHLPINLKSQVFHNLEHPPYYYKSDEDIASSVHCSVGLQLLSINDEMAKRYREIMYNTRK